MRPPRGKRPTQAQIKRAADRAETRARGKEPVEECSPLDPPEIAPSKAARRKGRESGESGESGESSYASVGRPSVGRPSVGRPSKYRKTYARQARKMAAGGAIDTEIAQFLEITIDTLYRWSAERTEFSEALRVGKAPVDDRAERSLYQRATGFYATTERILSVDGKPTVVKVREYYPPDVGAAKLWLSNRRPDVWREKQPTDGSSTESFIGLLREISAGRLAHASGQCAIVQDAAYTDVQPTEARTDSLHAAQTTDNPTTDNPHRDPNGTCTPCRGVRGAGEPTGQHTPPHSHTPTFTAGGPVQTSFVPAVTFEELAETPIEGPVQASFTGAGINGPIENPFPQPTDHEHLLVAMDFPSEESKETSFASEGPIQNQISHPGTKSPTIGVPGSKNPIEGLEKISTTENWGPADDHNLTYTAARTNPANDEGTAR